MRFRWNPLSLIPVRTGAGRVQRPLQEVVVSEGAFATAQQEGVSLHDFLARHERGDWGDVTASKAAFNECAWEEGRAVLSRYLLPSSHELWIMTAENGRTVVLRREEY